MADRFALTRGQRWKIAGLLAQDRLPVINAKLDDVVPSKTLYSRFGKRAIDIVISGAAIVVTLPINVMLGIGAFIDVGRPVLFRQVRSGRGGRPFTIIKFRSMNNATDARGELLPASQRLTKFGTFIRKTSLDELLNFVSIFKGDMSLIGPRPLPPEYDGRYTKRHRARLAVRPGLECPPRFFDRLWTWQEQFENDVWYVENVSFRTDCLMVANLVRYALSPKSSAARASVSRGVFMGYDLNGVAITLEEVPQEYIDVVAEEDDTVEGNAI